MLARSDTLSQREAPAPAQQVEALTEIERKILDFMVQYLRSNTYQPSIREIGERFGIKSTKTVSEHLQALADKGRLERDPSRSRGVRILGMDLGAETVSVPCFSELPTSGQPGQVESYMSFDRRLGTEAGSFVVRAGAGDLAVLGVSEGDFLMVSPTSLDAVEDGAVVALESENGSGFHRCLRNGRGIVLEELRPGGERTAVDDPDAVRVIGRVTGFYRRMDEAGPVNLTQH